jgi:hypothetical protein
VVGKIVEPNLVMHTDIMFVAGLPFLTSVFKPLMLLLSTLIKSKSTADVKKAVDKQVATVQGEGFKVIEITSDGEGAVGAIKDDLDRLGCKVTIHSKNTSSADVDNKIRQLKNTMRSASVLPFLFPMVLTAALVAFSVSKINMTPSRANFHWYSPYELLLGRPLSVDRDLGGKGGNGPMGFCSRAEIFVGTSNTMADRTSPALFLTSKGNSYGSALFFKLDTKSIVSCDQWKALPMDDGTITRMNEIARQGALFPKKFPMFYAGRRIDDEPIDETDVNEQTSDYVGRVVVDSGSDAPTGSNTIPSREEEDVRIVRADNVRLSPEDVTQLEESTVFDDLPAAQGVENGGDEIPPSSGGSVTPREPVEIGGERSKYNYPVNEDSSRYNPVGAPWFLTGEALPLSGGRASRVRKAPDRLAFVASEELIKEVSSIMSLKSRTNMGTRLPFRPTGGRNRVMQAKLEERRERHHSAFIVAVDRAIAQFGDKAIESLHKELTGLHRKSVFKQVKLSSLSDAQRRKIIRSKMFLKEKFFPSGDFDKLKSRLVAGGDMQDRSEYEESETSSPTVGLSSVYLVLSVAAKEKRKVGSADVGTAYLNANMGKVVLMRIEKRLAQMLVELFPDVYTLDKDGCIYVQLEKALYGCVESAKLWYDEVSAALLSIGFVRNPHDICVFNTDRNGHQVTVCLYVDDLLITSVDEADIEWVVDTLRSKYETVSLNTGGLHSYLGQTFDLRVAGEVSVSMDGYTRDILDSSGVKGFRATPATPELYEITEGLPLLDKKQQDDFHSLVMRLMFLAQRARPDILTAVAFLSRRWGKVTAEDRGKLERVLMYLNSWPDLKMTLACEDELRVYGYVDASFAVHNDMKSHTGGIISLGKGSVHVSSKKQQLMTKSSTESELVGLSDQLPQVVWTRNFLQAQGYVMGPARIFQDNQSTLALVAKGRSTSSRTRHIAIRYFFVKDRVDSGEVEVVYKPTGEMRADIMTKPLQGDLFRKMRSALMGMDHALETIDVDSENRHDA